MNIKWEIADYLIEAKKAVDSLWYISHHVGELYDVRQLCNDRRSQYYINTCAVLDKTVCDGKGKKKELTQSDNIIARIYYERDMVTDFHEKYLLNEGRAKTLNDDWSLKREPRTPELVVDYTGNDKIGININEGELYLNTVGDVVVGCDWSYESQRKYRIGNVMDEKWLENIRSSKLCIEENS